MRVFRGHWKPTGYRPPGLYKWQELQLKAIILLREVFEWLVKGHLHSTSTFFQLWGQFLKKNYPPFSPFILQIPSIYLFNMRLDVCPGKELLHVDNVLAGQTHTYFLRQGSIFGTVTAQSGKIVNTIIFYFLVTLTYHD